MFRCVATLVCLFGCVQLCGCDKDAPPHTSRRPPPAPARTAPPAGPHWACDTPIIDFGEVWVGQPVDKEFQFRNTGTETLKLVEVQPRCSCSKVDGYTGEVAPGASGVIPFLVDTKGKSGGPMEEWVRIKTNDPSQPELKITLTGTIRSAYQAEVIYDAIYERDKAAGKKLDPRRRPRDALFGKIESDDRLHRIIRIRNTSGRPLVLRMQPRQQNSRFQADLKETIPGEEFELTITGEPPFYVGTHRSAIRFRTNIPEHQEFEFLIYAVVPPRVEIVPQRILYTPQKYKKLDRTIKITNHGDTPVDVLSIATSEPRYKIALLPRDPTEPNEEVITVDLPGGGYEVPPYGEVIEIKTNDHEKPVIRIPVSPFQDRDRPPETRPADKPLVLHPVAISSKG
ncbi:MAG: DUF1573 domain-containing protein [Phycisphaerae bacterium]|nr:DUF1573 domain-containing protein [Phycisphaerae bacterium]